MKTHFTNKWKKAAIERQKKVAIEATLDTLVGQLHTKQQLWF